MTSVLIERLERIASLRGLIEASRIRLPARLSLEKDLLNRSVHSSTWIEGNLLSLGQVAALSEHRNIPADEHQKLEVSNCIKAMRWMLVNRKKAPTENLVLKLHTFMTQSLLSPGRAGHYRNVQNYVINAKRIVIFTPPSPKTVRIRMKSLFQWLKTSDLHPVVRSAVFHHEFVTIHPFTDGNGRVARSASEWLLFQKGYDPLYTLGLDDFFARDRERYYEMIQQTRELDYDYSHWIEYIAEGLQDAAERVLRRIQGLASPAQGKLILTPKQDELLKHLAQKPMGSTEIGKLMKIRRARVNQLIKPLVSSGLVIMEGTTRAAKYFLKNPG